MQKRSIADLPPQFLLGLRDALSSALNVSITFFDADGRETAASRYHVGRRFTLDVCQIYHCSEDSPVKKAVCDVWDRQAVTAIIGGATVFDQRCGLGYNCFAAAIRTPENLYGLISAGERRLVGDNAQPYLDRSLELLNLSDTARDEYEAKWHSSHHEPFDVTSEQWKHITETVAVFGRFLALCVENWDRDIKRWSSIKAELLRTTPRVRMVVDRAKSPVGQRATRRSVCPRRRVSSIKPVAVGFS